MCCPKCPDTAPSPTIVMSSLQTTANSFRTTTEDSPHSTSTKAIPSPSPNSSSLASSLPTVLTTG